MNYSDVNWFIIAFIALLECIVIATSYPTKNKNQNNVTYNAVLDRPKRQSDDQGLSLALVAAIGALACRAPTTTPKPEPKKCKINVKQLKFKHPLIVDPHDHSKFLYPNDDGDIFFNENDPVFLSCSDNANFFQQIPNEKYGTFLCVCEDNFRDNARVYSLYNDLECNTYPKHEIIDEGPIDYIYDVNDDLVDLTYTYHKYGIGFPTDEHNNFLKIIEIIYYNKFSVPWYSKSVISKHLAGGQSIAKAKSMFDQKFCCNGKNIDMEDVYNQDKQDLTFRTLLYKNTYLRKNTDFVFNRGHLTPKGSMVYTAAARATFAYLNVAPQWKKINSGNWGRIEEHIAEMAKTLKKDLTVYTGVYDGLALKDTGDKDKLKPIFLHAVKKREMIEKEFPIALYSYKIVLDLEDNSGVVFVTVNNPFIDYQKVSEYHICDNPIIKQNGVKMPKQWKPKSIELGYSYMCHVNDFLDKTDMTPLDMRGLTITKLLYIPDPSSSVPSTTTVATTTFWRDPADLKK